MGPAKRDRRRLRLQQMKQSAANFHRFTTKVSRAAPRWDKHDSTGSDIGRPQVVAASLEMLSGRSKKEYAKEAQAVAEAPDAAPAALGPAYAIQLVAVHVPIRRLLSKGKPHLVSTSLRSHRRLSSRLGGAGALWHNVGRVIRSV